MSEHTPDYDDTSYDDIPVTITLRSLLSLFEDALTYAALSNAGVDNWSGYDEADFSGIDGRVHKRRVREIDKWIGEHKGETA